MRLSIVIPCLNEARTIADVVREGLAGIAACGDAVTWSEIVVSDNGSTDGSQDLAAAAGARVVRAPVRGYGAALHWGIVQARGDYVLLADADKSHDLALTKRFVDAMADTPGRGGRHDLILGSRLAGEIRPGAMPALNRYLGTPLLNTAIRICFGLRTSDCNSGMRLVDRTFYRRLGMRCPGMEFASELLLKCALRGGRYAEIPIHVRPDERGRPPHLRRWRDGWRHLKSIIMLAPNVTVVAPALLCGVAGAALVPTSPVAAYALIWFAWAGLLVAAGIKQVLHVDGVRTSRVIAKMLSGRTAEAGLVLMALLAAAGVLLLVRTLGDGGSQSAADAAGAAFLLAGSGVTALGVLHWETARTLLVSQMDAAWDLDPRPRSADARPD